MYGVNESAEVEDGIIHEVTVCFHHAFIKPHLHAGIDCEKEFADEDCFVDFPGLEYLFVFFDAYNDGFDACGCGAVFAEKDLASASEVIQLLDELDVSSWCFDFLFA